MAALHTTSACAQAPDTTPDDHQVYLAFAAVHLRDAVDALEKAIAEAPKRMAHWNDVLSAWRAQLSALEAEAVKD